MKVICDVEQIVLEGDSGRDVPSVEITCGRCSHRTTSYGTSERSIKRCLVLLREECPKGESNYYEENY